MLWAPEGRSNATAERARAAGLTAAPLEELIRSADVVLSICPPHAALDVARTVAALGYWGLLRRERRSPATARGSGGRVEKTAARRGRRQWWATAPAGTRLYLSGERADEVQALFAGTALEPVGWTPGGTASALKACYAGLDDKGSAALLIAVAEA